MIKKALLIFVVFFASVQTLLAQIKDAVTGKTQQFDSLKDGMKITITGVVKHQKCGACVTVKKQGSFCIYDSWHWVEAEIDKNVEVTGIVAVHIYKGQLWRKIHGVYKEVEGEEKSISINDAVWKEVK